MPNSPRALIKLTSRTGSMTKLYAHTPRLATLTATSSCCAAAPRREKDYHEHDGCLHEFGRSLTETRDHPKYANGPKHEARSKYEKKIERAGFQNPHDDLLPLGATGCRPLESKVRSCFIGTEGNLYY